MAFTKNIAVLVMLLLLSFVAFSYSQSLQSSPQSSNREEPFNDQDNQGDADLADDYELDNENRPVAWTTCNFTTTPRISCHDCNTRLICKPIGGLLKQCRNPFRPHCKGGICSPIPSTGCA